MYKDFVKAKIAYSNGTMDADSIVTEELDKYPYKRKEELYCKNIYRVYILVA